MAATSPRPPPTGGALHTVSSQPSIFGFGPGLHPSASPQQRASFALDSSEVLCGFVEESSEGWLGLLGDLQSSFLAFLVSHSFEGLAAWKVIVDAVLRAEDALTESTSTEEECFWVEALGTLLPTQIRALEEGLGGGVDESGSVVACGLSRVAGAGERMLRMGLGTRQRRGALAQLLKSSLSGAWWKNEGEHGAALGGAFTREHVLGLVDRLGTFSDDDGATGVERRNSSSGHKTVMELLRELEIQGGDGDLPSFE